MDSPLVLTQAAVMQHCTVELITVLASCVDPARTSSGEWLLHDAARRYCAAVGITTLEGLIAAGCSRQISFPSALRDSLGADSPSRHPRSPWELHGLCPCSPRLPGLATVAWR